MTLIEFIMLENGFAKRKGELLIRQAVSAGLPDDVVTSVESIISAAGSLAAAFAVVSFWVEIIRFLELLDVFAFRT